MARPGELVVIQRGMKFKVICVHSPTIRKVQMKNPGVITGWTFARV